MDEKLFYIHPTKVKIHTDLPRFRQEYGNVDELAESMRDKGQLQPIVVNREMQLVAGGRRLAAALKSNIEVMCIYSDAVDPIEMRELEIEENIQRKQFTPAEELQAIAELHELKQKRYGTTTSGKKGGHKLDDTAAIIGKTRGTVLEAISLASALEQFPELKKCKTKNEIKKAVKAIEVVKTRGEKSEQYKTDIASRKQPFELYLESAEEFYKRLEPNSVDILCTDPIYGIDIDKTAISSGGVTGGFNASGFKFDDSRDEALYHYKVLAERSITFTHAASHAYVFVGPEFFWDIRQIFTTVGWMCHIKPLIWIKRQVGQCNAPHAWPSSCYEMLLYARRCDSKLQRQGQPDWIECPPIPGGSKRHPTEKPVKLLRELISRSAMPGAIIVDPFMGSASTLEAACTEQCFAKGCDKLPEAYNVALERMSDWSKNQQLMDITL